MTNYQLTVTVAEHGHSLEAGEMLSHGFATKHPEVEAVIEQNTVTGELSATFWYEAGDDFQEAAKRGSAIFTQAANASGLKPTSFVGAKLVAVEHDRELQPA